MSHDYGGPHERKVAVGALIRVVGLALLPAGITASSLFAGASRGTTRTNLVLLAIFLTLVVSGANIVNEVRSRKTAAVERVQAQLFSQAGGPLVSILGSIASQSSRDSRLGDTKTLIVSCLDLAQRVCGRYGTTRGTTRAVFYWFTSPDRLERYDIWKGREGPVPRPEFVVANDQRVIERAKGEDSLLVKDLDRKPPEGYVHRAGREYKTFLAVPVRAGGHSYGFLTVDSDRTFSLTSEDVGYVKLMGGILGAALALIGDEYPLLNHRTGGGT
jgi:hypothetical protein